MRTDASCLGDGIRDRDRGVWRHYLTRARRSGRLAIAAVAVSGLAAAGLLSGCGTSTSASASSSTSASASASASAFGPSAVPSSAVAGTVSAPTSLLVPSVSTDSTKSVGPTTVDHGTAHSGGGDAPDGLLIGNLGVRDQSGNGQVVTLAAEIDGSPGWVAICSDDHGRAGALLGTVHRADGQHDDVVIVTLRNPVRSGYYWATLHVDAGTVGRFDYPGPDVILSSGNLPLTRRFLLTVR